MKAITRIEQSLAAALAMGEAPGCPPKLAGAVRHAVFPGGARIRPQLCLAVAQACGNDDPLLADVPLWPSSFCTVHLWYTTICRVLMTPRHAGAARLCIGPMANRWPCWRAMP